MRRAGVLKSNFSFLVMVLLMWGTTALAKDLNVPSEYTSIQAAVDTAVPGDVVLVEDGTYSGGILVQKAITIKPENESTHPVIDCANASRGFTFVGAEASGAVLSGFTITRGNGKVPENSKDIYSDIYSWQGFGGAILFLNDASATITDCTISGNTESIFAGVISCVQSSPVLKRCIIENNIATYGGGLVCYLSSSPTLVGCTITNNKADLGGGAYVDTDSSPTFISCLIAGNSADQGGGAFYITSNCFPNFVFCTLTGNSVSGSSAYGGGGIFSYDECSTSITDSILWGNQAANGPEIYLCSSSIAIDHSDVSRGEQDSSIYIDPTEDPTAQSEILWGEGNINQDPLFVAEADYYLNVKSPCIDSGIDLTSFSTAVESPDELEYDIEGDLRVMGSAPDMGAYELTPKQDAILVVEIDIKPGCRDKKINLKCWGVLPVAVKSTMDFDARSIDPRTVVFAGAAPIGYIRHDIDRDRDKDMLFFFKIKKLDLDEDSTEATLSGKTREGKFFEGTSKVNIEKPKRKAKGFHFWYRR
jgi:hypothetical protein